MTETSTVIREARRSARLTQVELARRLGTTQSVISRWERGGDEPRVSTLRRIVRACGKRLVLSVEPDDVDRSQIRAHLAMPPGERLAAVANVSGVLATARRVT